MKRTTVNDATDWFQFGQSTSDTFYNFDIGELTSSSWNKYPTKYKFILGIMVVSWYSRIHAVAILISELFVTRSKLIKFPVPD